MDSRTAVCIASLVLVPWLLGPLAAAPPHTSVSEELEPNVWRAVQILVAEQFGTPAAPRVLAGLPIDFGARDLDLGAAAGWKIQRGRQLYTSHCVRCHGEYGDAGPATDAEPSLDPRPRDFRRGVFKWKSTRRFDLKPTRHDLQETVRLGVPGTAMRPVALSQADRAAVTEYVRWLALRGEAEYLFVQEVFDEFDLNDLQADGAATLATTVDRVQQAWRVGARETSILRPPRAPAVTPESLQRGRALWSGVANCHRCHGADGRGIAWATPPLDHWKQPAEPWDLTVGPYRGGAGDDELFRRIRAGIAGSIMPASRLDHPDSDIWALVHYSRSLQTEAPRQVVRRREPPVGDADEPPIRFEPPTQESPFDGAGFGRIRGRFLVQGVPPRLAPRVITVERTFCGDSAPDSSLRLGVKQGLANVVVFLQSKDPPTPRASGEMKPVVLQQRKCRFEPHVLAFESRRGLRVRNADPIAMNVNLRCKSNSSFNQVFPSGGERLLRFEFGEPEPARVVNNIAPWMLAYVLPCAHPHFAVTDADGRFEIPTAPSGKQIEYRVWHERLARPDAGPIQRGRLEIDLRAGQTLDLGDIHIPAAGLR